MIAEVGLAAMGILVVAAGAAAFAMMRSGKETSAVTQALPFGIEAIVGFVLVLGAIGGSAFKLPGLPGDLQSTSQSSVNSDAVLPTRMTAGPGQYPPSQFKAYGIVAFKTGPTGADKDRYDMICDAYVSSLPYYKDVKAPPQRQMVTVWPLEKSPWADKINAEARQKVCAGAVAHYGVVLAQEAIKDAKQNGAALDGQGPFLLAWSPGSVKGRPDALVLVADLSTSSSMAGQADFRAMGARYSERSELVGPDLESGEAHAACPALVRQMGNEIAQHLQEQAVSDA
ncbi:hypothetical protein [Bradyrhizobium sp. UFLA05-112]